MRKEPHLRGFRESTLISNFWAPEVETINFCSFKPSEPIVIYYGNPKKFTCSRPLTSVRSTIAMQKWKIKMKKKKKEIAKTNKEQTTSKNVKFRQYRLCNQRSLGDRRGTSCMKKMDSKLLIKLSQRVIDCLLRWKEKFSITFRENKDSQITSPFCDSLSPNEKWRIIGKTEMT